MKSITLLISLLFFVFIGYSQEVVLRGNIIKKNICEFLPTGGYKVNKSFRITNAFIKITQSEFTTTGSIVSHYDLSDKQVDSSDGKFIVHFYAMNRNNVYILALKECEGNILAALFPIDNSGKFVEYTIKLIEPKKQKKVASDKII